MLAKREIWSKRLKYTFTKQTLFVQVCEFTERPRSFTLITGEMCSAGPFFFWTFESHKVLLSSVKQSRFEVSPLYVDFSFFLWCWFVWFCFKNYNKVCLGGKTCWKVLFVSRMKNLLLWLHVQNTFLSCLCNISRNWTGGQLYCHLSLYHKMAQWNQVSLRASVTQA